MIIFRFLLLRRARNVENVKLKRKNDKDSQNKIRDATGTIPKSPINDYLKYSMSSSRRPSWIQGPDEQEQELEDQLKVDNKYCEDLASAFQFWDNQCIVDAYFN